MSRLGLYFNWQRVMYQPVTFQCTHENRAWIHKALFSLECPYLSKTRSTSKIKFLSSSFTPIMAKSFSDRDIYSYSCHLFSSAKNSHDSSSKEGDVRLSQKQKLQIAIRDYGAVVVVFHIGISLLSLAGFYLAIANGFDVVSLLQKTGLSDNIMNSKVLLEGSTFVIAYGIHKLFAPVRIAITLSTAPFIVRYLRKIQILKSSRSK